MKTYHQLEGDNYLDYGVQKTPKLSNDISFITGRLITEVLPELKFEMDFPVGENPPHFLGSYIPIVSEQFVKSLKNVGIDNFQLFPAMVINPDTGEEWDGYSAFNVIGLIQAADLDHSNYDGLMAGDVEGVGVPLIAFRNIALKASKTGDFSMFRLAESPDVLIVDEEITDELLNNRPQGGWGIDLIEVEMT